MKILQERLFRVFSKHRLAMPESRWQNGLVNFLNENCLMKVNNKVFFCLKEDGEQVMSHAEDVALTQVMPIERHFKSAKIKVK